MLHFGGTLGVLNNPTFRVLWLAALASNLGALIQTVGAAWMMTSLSSSQSMVTLVQSSTTLPIMICSLAAGVLADNFDRRRVMLVAQCFMLAVSLVLMLLALGDLITPWILLACTFLVGCGTALHYPSWLSSLVDIVDREELPAAVSVNAMGMNLTRSVGPAAGGAIVAAAGAAAAFAVNAASFLAIIAALIAWRPRMPPRRLPRERFGGALAAGLRYFAMSPHLMRVVFRGSLFCFAAIIAQAMLPLVARDLLGGGALTYGVLLGCFGLGAVASALATAGLRTRLQNQTIATIGFLGFAGSAATLAVSDVFALSALAMFVAGGCWLGILSLINASVQMSTPRWVAGRMIALYMSGIFGAMAVGSWVWGVVADLWGIPASLLASAGVLVLGALWGLRRPLPPLAPMNLDAVSRFTMPKIGLELTHRSGPVAVLIEYEIAEGDVAEFLATMNRRRRIRLRDGARNWSLMRDVEGPERWLESFHFPTWIDYLRHHERRTAPDVEISDRLLALHRGPKPLRVRRMLERQTSFRTGAEAGFAAAPSPPC